MKCHCKNIDFGTYENTVVVRIPWKDVFVGIDTCLATEIGYLWHQGIQTIESCCGHGKNEGYILVHPEDCQNMIVLGYRNLTEKERARDNSQFFFPKYSVSPPQDTVCLHENLAEMELV